MKPKRGLFVADLALAALFVAPAAAKAWKIDCGKEEGSFCALEVTGRYEREFPAFLDRWQANPGRRLARPGLNLKGRQYPPSRQSFSRTGAQRHFFPLVSFIVRYRLVLRPENQGLGNASSIRGAAAPTAFY